MEPTVESARRRSSFDNPFGNKQELNKKFGFWAQLGIAFVILT